MVYYFNVLALRQAMLEYNLTEAALARTIGVSRACINRIIKNERQPSTKVISGLKIAFPEKSLDYFFTAMNSMPSDENHPIRKKNYSSLLDERKLIERIENLRSELERMAEKEGVRSSSTLAMSKKLDEALNKYYEFIRNR